MRTYIRYHLQGERTEVTVPKNRGPIFRRYVHGRWNGLVLPSRNDRAHTYVWSVASAHDRWNSEGIGPRFR